MYHVQAVRGVSCAVISCPPFRPLIRTFRHFSFFRHKLRTTSHANSNRWFQNIRCSRNRNHDRQHRDFQRRRRRRPASRRAGAASQGAQRSKDQGWRIGEVGENHRRWRSCGWRFVYRLAFYFFFSNELAESSVRNMLMGISMFKTQTLPPRPLPPRYQRQHQSSTPRIPPRSTSQSTSSSRKRHLPASPSMASSPPVPSRRSLRNSCAR